MSMDLGTLTAYLAVDGDAFSKGFDKAGESIKEWGNKAPGWIGGATGMIVTAGLAAGVALAAAVGQGLSSAMDLEDARQKISAELGLTEEQARVVGETVGSVFANGWGESAAQVGDAARDVVSSIDGMRDASQEALESMTIKALDFATAFEVETARSTQIVGQLIKTGLVADAEEGFDLLTAAMQKVPTNLRADLVDAVDEYGPFFAAIGYSGEEAMSALVAAADKGMYGIDKTGDAVKEFSIRATDMSTASVAAYEAAGLSAEEMSAKILAGGEEGGAAFQQIVDGLLGIEDPVARANAAIGLFGTPLEDLGVHEIPTFLESLGGMTGGLGEVAGAADAMGATLNDTASVAWLTLSRQWDAIVAQVGTMLLPVLRGVMDFLLENPAILQIVAVAIGVLAAAFVALSVATWIANTALLANPITWIVIGIVALIAALALLVMNWDSVVAWVTEVWGGFLGWMGEVIDGFVVWWNDLWSGFASWIGEVWEGFVGFITDVWQGFQGWIISALLAYVAFWTGLWRGVGDFISGVWRGFVGMVTDIWNGFLSFIIASVLAYVSFWLGVWGGVSSFFSGLWSGIVGFVTDAWGNIMSFLGGIPGKIQGVFVGAGRWLYQIGRDILDGLWDGLESIWSGLVGWIEDIGNQIADTFAGVLGIASPSRVFRQFGVDTMRGYIQGIDGMVGSVDRRMATLPVTPEMATIAPRDATSAPLTAERGSRVIHYHAAENATLTAEEQLFAALGSPRVKEDA